LPRRDISYISKIPNSDISYIYEILDTLEVRETWGALCKLLETRKLGFRVTYDQTRHTSHVTRHTTSLTTHSLPLLVRSYFPPCASSFLFLFLFSSLLYFYWLVEKALHGFPLGRQRGKNLLSLSSPFLLNHVILSHFLYFRNTLSVCFRPRPVSGRSSFFNYHVKFF